MTKRIFIAYNRRNDRHAPDQERILARSRISAGADAGHARAVEPEMPEFVIESSIRCWIPRI